jgi:hypothetical protein
MTNQHNFVSADRIDRVLNAAIVHTGIGESLEEYLEVFDAFYADDIEVSSDAQKEPIRGKARVRSLLYNFLVPFHIIAEVAGLSTSIRETPIPGDAPNQTHSQWTLDLVGASGATCTLSWCTLRKWSGSRVVYEHHYDHQQRGGPLTLHDFELTQKGELCPETK